MVFRTPCAKQHPEPEVPVLGLVHHLLRTRQQKKEFLLQQVLSCVTARRQDCLSQPVSVKYSRYSFLGGGKAQPGFSPTMINKSALSMAATVKASRAVSILGIRLHRQERKTKLDSKTF